MTVQPSLLFVAGLGYSATRLARLWPGAMAGTVRSEARAGLLRESGVDVAIWAGAAPLQVPAGARLLVSVPPDADGCPVARQLAGAASALADVVYLSTTGVYGDLNGGWAFEWSPLNPQSARAKARARAEAQWLALTGGQARIVRLPGIYGPGRSPFERLRAGTAQRIVKPGQVFSRIHVDDLASGLCALFQHPAAAGVFHLCDDEPAPPQDVTAFAAGLLGMAPPAERPFGMAGLSPVAASFYAECKRVSNARAKAALGWRPQYPTYREGLKAVYVVENGQEG